MTLKTAEKRRDRRNAMVETVTTGKTRKENEKSWGTGRKAIFSSKSSFGNSTQPPVSCDDVRTENPNTFR